MLVCKIFMQNVCLTVVCVRCEVAVYCWEANCDSMLLSGWMQLLIEFANKIRGVEICSIS